jgi:hypothetical protein
MLTSLGFVIGYVYFGGKGEVLDWDRRNSIRLMPHFGENNLLYAGKTDVLSFRSKPGLSNCELISLHLRSRLQQDHHAHVMD